ncbi:MAG: hypothetical protein OZSIB_3309 [Candidatus Ozemobacter sibiricus]|jgi:hypothetical protein|uniref:Uncharacterized protein n=1 Tax=Candidatus Ozemobacter sibiricus TaxID=2268124 RepID=A0A367ZFT0_9BACT|nr:MAG: hypothetical protein OZSIB_3309 [Candidatus Ozemobacter sibiricus]
MPLRHPVSSPWSTLPLAREKGAAAPAPPSRGRGLRRSVGAGFLAVLLLLTTGCGGGGGGGEGGGTGIDPVETEVRAALDVFQAAVQNENLTQARGSLSPSLRYFRAGVSGWEDHTAFLDRLAAFFDSATLLAFDLRNLGVSPGGETAATARGTLVCRYQDAGGTTRELTEEVELQFERVETWQITSLSRFNLAGMAFPP